MGETTATADSTPAGPVEADAGTGGEALDSPTPESGTGDPGGDPNGREDGAQPEEPARGRAASYRQRAQEAETARDTALARVGQLEAVVEQFQRSAVEQAAAEAGLKPTALWAVSELAELLDDAGQPDSEKIAAAVDAARDQLGVARPRIHRQLGMRSGASAPEQPRQNPWAAAFAPTDR
jgi:hypothetical protein